MNIKFVKIIVYECYVQPSIVLLHVCITTCRFFNKNKWKKKKLIHGSEPNAVDEQRANKFFSRKNRDAPSAIAKTTDRLGNTTSALFLWQHPLLHAIPLYITLTTICTYIYICIYVYMCTW